jgi:hypothetical protein
MNRKIKILLIVIVFIIIVAGLLLILRGDEDTWICENGEWVKYGNPKNPPPENQTCKLDTDVVDTSTNQSAGVFKNGQPYKTYEASDIEVKYPYWPSVAKEDLLAPEKTKLAVSNEGCNFVVTSTPVPGGYTFKSYMEKLLDESKTKTGAEITRSEIGEMSSIIDGYVMIGGVNLHSLSYGYLTSDGNSYGVGFIAEEDNFESACRRFVNEVIESVVVK